MDLQSDEEAQEDAEDQVELKPAFFSSQRRPNDLLNNGASGMGGLFGGQDLFDVDGSQSQQVSESAFNTA